MFLLDFIVLMLFVAIILFIFYFLNKYNTKKVWGKFARDNNLTFNGGSTEGALSDEPSITGVYKGFGSYFLSTFVRRKAVCTVCDISFPDSNRTCYFNIYPQNNRLLFFKTPDMLEIKINDEIFDGTFRTMISRGGKNIGEIVTPAIRQKLYSDHKFLCIIVDKNKISYGRLGVILDFQELTMVSELVYDLAKEVMRVNVSGESEKKIDYGAVKPAELIVINKSDIPEEKNICNFCNKEIPDGNKFCIHCGKKKP